MHRISLVAGLVLLLALPVAAQSITLADALERAHQSAPAVVAARMRVEEARARVVGVSRPFSSNPTLEVEAGRRSGDLSSTDFAVDVGQDLDLPQRRQARIDAARAVVTQEEQQALEVERGVLHDVATVFLRALEARERADVAGGGKRLADAALQIAERRYAAGDVAQLDVNLARTAGARADAEVGTANALLTGQLTQLQVLLGMTQTVTAGGSLHDAWTPAMPDLVVTASDRPDVRALDAEVAEAEAEQRLARLLRWPDFGVRASYRQEGRDRILLGGIGLTLPVVHRGQDATAIASARLARLHAQREALTRTIEAEVRGAVASYEALRETTAQYERTVLPLVEENERLALESYDVGQIGLAELLLVRREALDARRALIDQLIATRLAEVELRMHAGVWK